MKNKFQQLPKSFVVMAALTAVVLALAAILVSCNQPLVSAGVETKSLDLGGLLGPMQSRSTNNIQSARVFIADENQKPVFDETYNQPPANNQVLVDLVLNKRYFLELTINCVPSGTNQSFPLVYKKSFTMPETGNLDINIDFPGPDDWAIFNPIFNSEIGPKIGWNGSPPNPMSTAFGDASLPANASLSSNSGIFGDFRWAWNRQGATVVARITALVDIPLGGSGYVMLKDSYQDLANAPTPGCQEDFRFSGGQIKHVFSVYDGTQSSVITQLLVNDFDYLSFYISGPSASPAPTLIHVALNANGGNDVTGNGSAASPYATINKAVSVAPYNSQILVSQGSFSEVSQLNLPNGVSLMGGFDYSTWSRNITAYATTLLTTPPTGPATAIAINNAMSPAEISGLTINCTAIGGQNSYAINITNSQNIAVRDNKITAIGANSTVSVFGVVVNDAFSGVIERNTITVSNASAGSNYGIMFANQASTGYMVNALVHNNAIIVGNSMMTDSIGIAWSGNAGTTANLNLLARNNSICFGVAAVNTGMGIGAAQNIQGTYTAHLQIDNNLIFASATGTSAYAISAGEGAQISGMDIQSIQNNYLSDNLAGAYHNVSVPVVVPYNNINGSSTFSAVPHLGNLGGAWAAADYDSLTLELKLTGTNNSALIGAGLNGASLGWGFSDDRTGTVRVGNWSIGAYQVRN